jgi:hypothetical protein
VLIASSGFGMGIANPASNNAAIDQPSNNAAIEQAPDKAASITRDPLQVPSRWRHDQHLVRRARAVPAC